MDSSEPRSSDSATRPVTERPQPPEIGPSPLRVGRERRQDHEALDAEGLETPQVLEGREEEILVEAELGLLAGKVHLHVGWDHSLLLGGVVLEMVGELHLVEGLDDVEEGHRLLRLVLLEVPHQVPAEALRLQIRQGRSLGLRLLHPVLTEVA